MYLITRKEDNVCLNFGNELDYISNGYPRIVEKDIAFVKENVNVFEVTELPEDFKQGKHCYTEEKGFYVNPDYVEPDPTNTYGIPDELFNQIKSDYREQIAQEVSENGYNA